MGLNSLMKFSCRRSLGSVHWASLLNMYLLIILQTELKLRQVYVGAGDSCHNKNSSGDEIANVNFFYNIAHVEASAYAQWTSW